LRARHDCNHDEGAKKQFGFAVCHRPTVRGRDLKKAQTGQPSGIAMTSGSMVR